VIGGVAVGYHGHVRATKDVDVVPAPDAANLERMANVLRRLDAQVEGADEFDNAELPDPLDAQTLAQGGNWPNAVEDEVAGLPIKIVGYDDLVALKEHAGRPRT
jgi:hypothetical protein